MDKLHGILILMIIMYGWCLLLLCNKCYISLSTTSFYIKKKPMTRCFIQLRETYMDSHTFFMLIFKLKSSPVVFSNSYVNYN